MIAPLRCDWTPLWSENHSRSYGLSDKSAGSRFAQPKAGPQGAAQDVQRKSKYKRAWTSEGPDRSGTEDKQYL